MGKKLISSEEMNKKWIGSEPDNCELCHNPYEGYFIDGMTNSGRWALMCVSCHRKNGGTLGTGYGQKYDLKTREDVTPITRYPKRRCDSCDYFGAISWLPGYWQCPNCNVGNEED